MTGPVRGPELALEQLARARAGEFAGEGHRAGALVPGQVLAGVGDHVSLRQRPSRGGHHGGVHLLTPLLGRDPEDRDIEDAWMLFHGGLDLRGAASPPARTSAGR